MACHAMSGTDLLNPSIPARYAVSGTDLAYGVEYLAMHALCCVRTSSLSWHVPFVANSNEIIHSLRTTCTDNAFDFGGGGTDLAYGVPAPYTMPSTDVANVVAAYSFGMRCAVPT
eukprot:1728229-Rhodomonas_salina.4